MPRMSRIIGDLRRFLEKDRIDVSLDFFFFFRDEQKSKYVHCSDQQQPGLRHDNSSVNKG